MAFHRETTFKKTRSQYLTDHHALNGQPCAMRPTNLGRRHGEGKGWDGKQHSLWQKCWKPCYRNSEMSTSKSMSEAESEPTSYIIWYYLSLIVVFNNNVQPQYKFCVGSSWFAYRRVHSWHMSVQSELSIYITTMDILCILLSIAFRCGNGNRAKHQGLHIRRFRSSQKIELKKSNIILDPKCLCEASTISWKSSNKTHWDHQKSQIRVDSMFKWSQLNHPSDSYLFEDHNPAACLCLFPSTNSPVVPCEGQKPYSAIDMAGSQLGFSRVASEYKYLQALQICC